MLGSLLFTGVPIWQHSHPGGDRPHYHHDHGHPDHEGTGLAHAHVTLFGVEFTIPAESSNDESDESRATFLIAAPVIACEMSHDCSLVHLAQPILNAGELIQIVPAFRCKTAIAAPLCDTARHERSGVQLI